MAKKEKRFVRVLAESALFLDTSVLVDRETGVNYLLVSSSSGNGLTPLLDGEGKPIVSDVSRLQEV